VDGNKVDLTTQDGASDSIARIDAAIKKVSLTRGQMGAIQNRLEHTISNLDTASENTQSAESRIRDVDMADEMVEYSKNNILAQAGQSMLAQANQSTQGVLSLLQ
jgi:flagellin